MLKPVHRERPGHGVPLSLLVVDWVRDGIIDAAQARAILAGGNPDVASARAPSRGRSVLIESLGYLGAAIMVVAVMLLAARYWSDVPRAGQVGLLGAAALALTVAGVLVPARGSDQLGRLRAVLWVGATVGTGAFLALLGDGYLGLHDARLALLVGAGTTAQAAALWWSGRTAPLQALTVAAAGLTASALIAVLTPADSLPGLGAWTVGSTWWVLAAAKVTPDPGWGRVSGAVVAIVGAMTTASADWGMLLVLGTLLAVVVLGMAGRDVMQLGVAVIGLLINLPPAVNRWFPGSAVAPLVLLVVGTVVVVLAVDLARRVRRGGELGARPR